MFLLSVVDIAPKLDRISVGNNVPITPVLNVVMRKKQVKFATLCRQNDTKSKYLLTDPKKRINVKKCLQNPIRPLIDRKIAKNQRIFCDETRNLVTIFSTIYSCPFWE
jgi:hypothetical protein